MAVGKAPTFLMMVSGMQYAQSTPLVGRSRTDGAMITEFPINKLSQVIAQQLSTHFHRDLGFGKLSVIDPKKTVLDNPVKLLASSTRGRPLAVVICANPQAPTLVERGHQRILAARELLPSELAANVLAPVAAGHFDGLSYVVLPYCRQLSGSRLAWRIQRAKLRPHVLTWLRGVVRTTGRNSTAQQVRTLVDKPLEFMAWCEDLGVGTRQAAKNALRRLRAGVWKPSLTLAHNDLWRGNILLPDLHNPLLEGGNPQPRFYIIDWSGASRQGQTIYDLIRVGRSFCMPQRIVRAELLEYCKILDCELVDCMSCLLVGLGAIGLNLEHFPFGRFIQLSESCFADMALLIDH